MEDISITSLLFMCITIARRHGRRKRSGGKGGGSVDGGSTQALNMSCWRRRRGSNHSVRESLWRERSEELSETLPANWLMGRWWVWVHDPRLRSPGF
jgi:hypothetical protein